MTPWFIVVLIVSFMLLMLYFGMQDNSVKETEKNAKKKIPTSAYGTRQSSHPAYIVRPSANTSRNVPSSREADCSNDDAVADSVVMLSNVLDIVSECTIHAKPSQPVYDSYDCSCASSCDSSYDSSSDSCCDSSSCDSGSCDSSSCCD